jgi:hypothetical protein
VVPSKGQPKVRGESKRIAAGRARRAIELEWQIDFDEVSLSAL